MFRSVLGRDNLSDTNTPEAPPRARAVPPVLDDESGTARSFHGRGSDMSMPDMDAVGMPFCRNMNRNYRPDLFDTPNPITVSETLLKRETFIPARSLNILAAAWIQFQVHDWVDHARYALGQNDVRVPLPQDFPGWRNTPDGPPEEVMRIAGNIALSEREGLQYAFGNQTSHWWAGSEVYGATLTQPPALRERARIGLPGVTLPPHPNVID